MTLTVYERIVDFLRHGGADFRILHHEPAPTSEDAARVRGVSLSMGRKALLLKSRLGYGLFVMSAERRIDSAAIRLHLGVNRLRFASTKELRERTGLVPGSVPPFGEPILPFPLYADPSVVRDPEIAFTAGTLTDSIFMPAADWQRLARPEVFVLTQDPG